MTHRKSSNVCPVCGVQGKMDAVVSYVGQTKIVGYRVQCRCGVELYPEETKKSAWYWFRNWHAKKMRLLKNIPREIRVNTRKKIRAGRLTREAINFKFRYAWIRNP